jgi:hypothetical protein
MEHDIIRLSVQIMQQEYTAGTQPNPDNQPGWRLLPET